MKTEKKDKIWTEQEEDFLRKNINEIPLSDLAIQLGRTENCLNIKLHRLRIERKKGGLKKEMVSRNLVIEMLTQRIGDPNSFRYTPEFRTRTGIMQKRFWQLFRGEKNLTQSEYLKLMREWNVTLEDAFEMKQLNIEF